MFKSDGIRRRIVCLRRVLQGVSLSLELSEDTNADPQRPRLVTFVFLPIT